MGDATVLAMAWQMFVRLFNSILSKPIKLDWAAVQRAPVKTVVEAIAIKDEISGLWKTVEAKKPDKEIRIVDRASPIKASNSMPETIIS